MKMPNVDKQAIFTMVIAGVIVAVIVAVMTFAYPKISSRLPPADSSI